MKLQLIRNATMKLAYAGRTILTDPMLSPQGAIESFAGIAPNPTIEMPFSIDEIVSGVQGVLVSHIHQDHFDKAAQSAIDKSTPIFCQPGDVAQFTEQGFQIVIPVEGSHTWDGITITRTGGRHGSGSILEMMGEVSGFVLQADGEPTVYWVGDSIWCEPVRQAIERFEPDLIITHSGGATLPGHDPIIMDGEQTLELLEAAPEATVVAVHFESLDHLTVSREAMRQLADGTDISPTRLLIPSDGQTLSF